MEIKAINMLDDCSDLEKLRARIAQNGGAVDVLVHPFFKLPGTLRYGREEPTGHYARHCQEHIINCLFDDGSPLIIFEERLGIESLLKRFSYGMPAELYVVPTRLYDPAPDVPGLNKQQSWKRAISLLRRLSVVHARVGGRYLYFADLQGVQKGDDQDLLSHLRHLQRAAARRFYAQRWLRHGLVPFGCAGSTAQHLLLGGFDVSLLPISSPEFFKECE